MKRSTDNFISLQVSGIYPTKSINKSSSIAFSNTLRNLKIFSLNHLIVAAALSNLLITYFFQICGRRNLPRCVASRYLPVQHQQGKHRDRHLSCVIIVKSEHMSHTNLWHCGVVVNNTKEQLQMHRFKFCSQCVGDLWWWESQNKADRLPPFVSNSAKTFHHSSSSSSIVDLKKLNNWFPYQALTVNQSTRNEVPQRSMS